MNSQENHRNKLGGILVNFHALEFALRHFLFEILDKPNGNTINLSLLLKSKVGESVQLNSLTNFDSLNELIKKVNKELLLLGISLTIDESIVEIRDAIAHGRVLSQNEDGPFSLVKFSKPIGKQTIVAFIAELENDWFDTQNKRIYTEIQKIIEISRTLGQKCFP